MNLLSVELRIVGLDCPDCARTAEREIARIEGVSSVRVDFTNRKLRYQFESDRYSDTELRSRIERLGHFKFAAVAEDAEKQLPFSRLAITTITSCLLLTTLAVVLIETDLSIPTGRALIYFAVVIGGFSTFRRALIGLRNKRIDMNVLMSLAIIGALVIDELYEAATVVLLFSLANMLESYSLWRLSRSISDLGGVTGNEVLLKVDGQVRRVSEKNLSPGDLVVIREGMRIPADGVVAKGTSNVNLSFLTGESRPQHVREGDELYAGAINIDGYLELQVKKRVEDSEIATIFKLVGEASSQRSRIERLVDKFARFYTPVVISLATLLAVVPPLLLGADITVWFYRALVFLVISCPCALVISTPVAVSTALASASRLKAVFKSGDGLERLARARIIAFDKTGTLTTGDLQLDEIKVLNGFSRQRLLQIAASLEQASNHPVAKAVRYAARHEGINPVTVERLTPRVGIGVSGEIESVRYAVGGIDVLPEKSKSQFDGFQGAFITSNDELIATLSFSERLRDETDYVIAQLRHDGFDKIGILSGDKQEHVTAMHQRLALDFAHGELKPADKLHYLQEFDNCAMIGDGINDAVALAGADVSLSVARFGSDFTAQQSDIILYGDTLSSLPQLFKLASRAVMTIKGNIAFAFAVKLLFLGLAAAGFASIWMAVIADMGASLLVIFNSLRLLRRQDI